MKTLLILLSAALGCSGAISFDGVSFATAKDSASLGFTNSITTYTAALKRGRITVDSYFVFGKGTSAYNYGVSYITVGAEYSWEFHWNDESSFAMNYAESATPGIVTNTWTTAAFVHNWGSDNEIMYNRGQRNTTINCGFGNCARASTNMAEPLEIAKGRGGFEKWNGVIGEIAIWNTNLTSRQAQILSGCKMKGMARQIRPTNLVLHLTMDHFAAGTALDGTNIIRDLSGRGNHASPITSPIAYPESYASYYPNE